MSDKPTKQEEADFADFLAKLEAPAVDAGPTARRAQAGGSPSGPRDLTAEEAGTMSGPAVTKNEIGPYGKPGYYTSTVGAAPADAPTDYTIRKPLPGGGEQLKTSTGNQNEMADPMVRVATAAAMGRGAGALAGASPVLGSVAGPAVEGGVANKAMGGDFVPGAIAGGGLAALGAAGKAAAARADRQLYKEIGRAAAGKAQEKVAAIGAPDMVKTAREIGIADAPTWAERSRIAGEAKQRIGAQIGEAWKPLDASPFGSRPTVQVVQALDGVKARLAQTTEGQQLVGAITEKQEALQKLYGDRIPLSALNREIGVLEQLGYSGGSAGQLSTKAAAAIPRQMAAAMEGELQNALGAARRDPGLSKSVDSVESLNKQYKATLAIDAIAKRAATKEQFAPTAGERFMKSRTPIRDMAAGAARGVTRPIMAGAEAIGRAAERAQEPGRQVAPAVVPIVQSLSQNNGADLSKHVESAVFGP